MPKQTLTKTRKAPVKSKRSPVKKTPASNPWLTKTRLVGILFVALFASFGTFYLLQSGASPNNERFAEDPARGISYKGLKIAESGPCAKSSEAIDESDEIDLSPEQSQRDENAGGPKRVKCIHPDAGPKGVDLRERVKQVDAMLDTQVAYDDINPAKNAGETPPPPIIEAENVGAPGSLSAVSPINWPCNGVGNDGSRVLIIYAYAAGAKDRGATYRKSFESIARRTNAVYYNSGVSSGGARQIRFHTNSQCRLTIVPETISGDINSYGNIVSQLRSKGYTPATRKYLVQVDGGNGANCGIGGVFKDDRPGQENYNNNGNMFAVTWKSCWNYAEPHELTHMLGSVQDGAPGATGRSHCFDQNDVMCYNDGAGIAMQSICPSSTEIWRLDCRKDTYFRSAGATGWLADHWNVANNKFLQP